ncbi:hypothetical protein [Lysobacter brunescens]|uniref:Porin n=1 Tax=Lysobacter brunescens TaxID=262323 RepID=A0ABW2YF25_9GAMM
MRTTSLLPFAIALACAGAPAWAQDLPSQDQPSQDQPSQDPASQAPAVDDTAVPETAVPETDATDDSALPTSPRWTGTASVAAVAASGTRDLDDAGTRFGLALRGRGEWRHSGWRALGEVAFGSDRLAYDAAPWLRQAWLSHASGRVEWRLGRQILSWGRADRLNPTDNLAPRNLRGLVADIDEDRMGLDSASVRLQLGERVNATFLHAPRMRATVLPDGIASIPTLFGGRRVADQVSDSNTQALRIDYAGNALDASISIVDGPSMNPAFVDALPPGFAPHAIQPGVRIVGADFSAALGDRWGVRGEFASTTFDGRAPAGLGDFRYAVLGVERHIDGGWLALAQWVHRRAEREPVALPSLASALNRAVWFQTEARSDAVYLGLNRAQFEGALSGNVGVLQTLDDRGQAWFANVAWRIDDHWNLLARWQHFSGPVDTNLGALRRDSLLLLELRGTWGGSR